MNHCWLVCDETTDRRRARGGDARVGAASVPAFVDGGELQLMVVVEYRMPVITALLWIPATLFVALLLGVVWAVAEHLLGGWTI